MTFKRLRRERQMVRLKPQNGEYEEIVVLAEDVKVQVQAVSYRSIDA